jgi:hypothetical protein
MNERYLWVETGNGSSDRSSCDSPTELRLNQIGRFKLGRCSAFDEEMTLVLDDPVKFKAISN